MNKQKDDKETHRKIDVHTDRQTDEDTNGGSSKSISTFRTEKNRWTHRQTDEHTNGASSKSILTFQTEKTDRLTDK